jgi:toxin-antitoxin system PIN domain toxin
VSFAVDVNLLLYASDSTSPLQPQAVAFLERCVRNREVFCLAWPTLVAYLRIATHPSVFTRPLSHDDAARNLEVLLRAPHVRVLSEEEGFWEIYRDVTGEVPTRGNLVPDAHLAALLRQHGVSTLWTADRDFLKFSFLEVRNPFSRA